MRILAIVALAIIAFGVVGYAFATHGDMANVLLRAAFRLGLAHQGIEGNATIWYWAGPFSDPTQSPKETLAVLRTEYAANDFPRLPVREDEHALVWLTRSPLRADVPAEVVKTENLRLRPTRRSTLH